MPLVNKQPFKPEPIPDNLGPDDEVFYHELTNEIFTSHDAYFDRFLYCNSLVWTCSKTGKSGLTYKEALDSERAHGGPNGDSDSPKKKRKRNKTNEVKNKRPSTPDDSKPESVSSDEKKPRKRAKTNDDKVKPSEDGDTTAEPKTNGDTCTTEAGQPVKRKKKKYPYDPKKYSMPVPEGFDPSLLTPTGKIDGRKLKSKQNQSLAEQLLQASGYEPKVPSPSKCGNKGKSKQEEAKRKEEDAKRKEEDAKKKQAELAKERELEAKRKKEAAALVRQLERQKKEEERKRAVAFVQAWEKKCEDLERDDLRRLPQPTPVNCEIPERLFGDSIFIMEAIYNFHDLYKFSEIYPDGLKFDTLEEILIDRQEDGALGALLTYLLRLIFDTQPTTDGYGLDDDSTMLAKAVGANSVNNVKDINNKSETDADGEGDYEPNGVEAGEQDEDDNYENNEKYVNMNDRIGSAIKAAQEVKKTFSKPLPDMEITPSNVTEILRLHLLQSGSFPKGRTIYNGWYSSREDPGLWLCMEEPDLMKKLGEVTVYDLEIEERIKILHTLIYQLLTFIKSRLYMEMASDQLLELRKQYRKEAADFARWDRENCVKRMQPPKRKTDLTSGEGATGQDNAQVGQTNQDSCVKLESHDQRNLGSNQPSDDGDDGDEETLNQNQRLKSCLKANGIAEDQPELGSKPKKITFKNGEVNGTGGEGNHEGELANGDTDKIMDEQAEHSYEEMERAFQQNKVDYEDYQRERSIRAEQLNEILLDIRTQLRNNQSVYAIHPIGRDRAYKRYWLFQSLPGLFVEQDDEFVGECLPQPTPLESRYKKMFGKENPLMHPNEAELIRPKTCDVACSTDSNDGPGSTSNPNEQQDKRPVVKKDPDEETTMKREPESNDNNNIASAEDENRITDRLNGDEDSKDHDAVSEHDGEAPHENGDGVIIDEMNYCTGDKATCYIHGPKRPTQKWWFYHTPESIEQLIECLNKRGYRESELHDALAAECANIKPRVAECEAYKLNKTILEQSGIRRSRRLRTKTGKRRGRNYE